MASTRGSSFRCPMRAVLGRHPECDIVLDQGAVSRQHAQISHVNGEYYIEDLQSRNGTWVNGQAIQAPQQLRDGDEVKICDLAMTFHREFARKRQWARHHRFGAFPG